MPLPLPPGDVGDTNGTAATLTLGQSVYGTIATVGDADRYAVQLVAGVTYDFRMLGVGRTALADPFLSLLDASGTQVDFNDDEGTTAILGANSEFSYTAAVTGTYYLRASEFEDNAVGDFLLTAVAQNPAGRVLTVDEVAWQLTNNFERFFSSQYQNVAATAYDVSDNGRQITYNDNSLTAEGTTLLTNALQMWADVTGIVFTDTAGAAEITVDDDAGGVNAYNSNTTSPDGTITASSLQVTTGWLTQFGTTFNSYAFETYIHELGHSLGLGHGGNYNGSATFGVDNYYVNDSQHLSLMSYMQSRNDEFADDPGFGYNDFVNAEFRWVLTPMIADILAMSNLYGLATNTRTANTTYGYNSNTGNAVLDALTTLNDAVGRNFVAFTVFDNGGIDTIDMSGFAGNQRIDLREGASSDVLGGTLNMGVAFGTVIEDAIGGAGDDTITGNGADNLLRGGAGNDVLRGLAGNDFLIADSVDDILIGGTGNDTYDLRLGVALIAEQPGQGTADSVASSTSYTLGLGLEDLYLYGSGDLSGYGNELNNYIVGDGGNDVLRGRDGNDTLRGQSGNDTLIGGAGNDVLTGDSGTDTAYYVDSASGLTVSLSNAALNTGIAAGDTFESIENLTGSNFDDVLNGLAGGIANEIRGGGGNDVLKGYSGNDTLNGGSGNDTLVGGSGNDILLGGSGNDLASYEAAATGVTASLANPALNTGDALGDTYNSIEGLIGSSHADVLYGSNNNDTLMGDAGNDTIRHYRGTDTVTGGSGDDTFQFVGALGAGNLANITDYNVAADRIQIDNAVFVGLAAGALAGAAFTSNAAGTATTAAHRIIYETDTGALWFDADGSGAGARVQFADLAGGLAMTAGEFSVI